MNGWQWGLIGWFAFSILISVNGIGKERKPTTPSQAVTGILLYAAMAYVAVRA